MREERTVTAPDTVAPPVSPALVRRVLTLILAVDLIIMLFLLDQVSKWAILETVIKPMVDPAALRLDFIAWLSARELPRLPFAQMDVTSFFSIVMVWNEGVSFGVFGGHNGAANMGLILMLSAIVLGFSVWLVRTPSAFLRFPIAAVIGGALGNIWDRMRFGAVADFLDFHVSGLHYPAFNVADSAIVLGIAAIVGYELFWGGRKPRQTTPAKGSVS